MNLDTLGKLLTVLSKIEDGTLDQHSGAYEVGTLLKKMYVDAALVKANRLEDEREKNESSKPSARKKLVDKTLTWKQYKARQNARK